MLFLLGVGLVALYVRQLDLGRALSALLGLSAGVLGLALVLYTIAWTLRVWRLHLLSRSAGIPATPGSSASTALGANALNLIAPARLGDVAAFVRLRGAAPSAGAAAAVLVHWRLTDLAGLLLLGLAGGAAVLLVGPPIALGGTLAWLLFGGVAALVVLAGGAVWAARRSEAPGSPGLLARLRDRVATRILGERAEGMGEGFSRANVKLLAPALLVGSVLLAVLGWVGDAAVAGVLLAAAWPHPGAFLVAVVPVVVGNVAKMVPSTPGALGVFEAAFAAALIPFGVPLVEAVAVAVATHLLMNAYTLVVGVPGAWTTARAVPRTLWRV